MNEFKIIKVDGTIDKEELQKYIEVPKIGEYFSAFSRCLFLAREFTGRDLNSGMRENEKDYDGLYPWTGLMLYLILIDHIGKKFSLKSDADSLCKKEIDFGERPDKYSYTKVIKFFYEESIQDTVDDMYTRRCSCVHEFEFENEELKITDNTGSKDIDEIVEKIIDNFLKLLKENKICYKPNVRKENKERIIFKKKFKRESSESQYYFGFNKNSKGGHA